MNTKHMLVFILSIIFGSFSTAQDMSITYYENSKPGQIDPIYGAQTDVGRRIVSLLFTPVLGLDASMVLVPYLATADPIVEGKIVTFILKENMRWHDGKPVTTQDVTSSFLMFKHEKNFYKRAFLKDFSQITAGANNQVTILLTDEGAFTKSDLNLPVLPSHIFPTGKILPNSPFTSDKPIGNGPFYVKENRTNKIIFERFDDFTKVINGEHTNIKTITLRVEPYTSQWAQDMIIGRVDLIPSLPTALIPELKDYGDVSLKEYANYSVEMIGFNFKNPLLRELFIREAFYFAVNREEMIDAELLGYGHLATGPYPAGSEYYWTELPSHPYDPDRAIKILEERCTRDPDGVFRFQGKRLSFRIMGLKGNSKFKNQVRSFTKQMKRVGIEIQNPEPMDYDGYLQSLRNRDFDLIWIIWKFDEALDISSIYQTGGTLNYFGYSNSRADAMFNTLKISRDRFIRKDTAYDIHRELHKDPPALFLWTVDLYAAYNKKRLSSITFHPNDFFYLVHQWRLRED